MVVTLVGYRGTGKSTVAGLLAARLRWGYVDADSIIENRAGCSIRQIFAEQGEPAFRSLEHAVLAKLLSENDLVIAAGGGAVLDARTRDAMRRAGPVVWLKASLETILQRLAKDDSTRERRPSLTGLDPREEVERLLAVREPLFAEVSSVQVITDDRTPDEIADEIVARLQGVRAGQ
jgi:shikimate kinase